jgi:hypothetical protein
LFDILLKNVSQRPKSITIDYEKAVENVVRTKLRHVCFSPKNRSPKADMTEATWISTVRFHVALAMSVFGDLFFGEEHYIQNCQ